MSRSMYYNCSQSNTTFSFSWQKCHHSIKSRNVSKYSYTRTWSTLLDPALKTCHTLVRRYNRTTRMSPPHFIHSASFLQVFWEKGPLNRVKRPSRSDCFASAYLTLKSKRKRKKKVLDHCQKKTEMIIFLNLPKTQVEVMSGHWLIRSMLSSYRKLVRSPSNEPPQGRLDRRLEMPLTWVRREC